MSIVRKSLCAGLFALASVSQVAAEQRVALLIGNADYEHAAQLANPGRDVRAMADVLDGLGFDVRALFDLDEDELERALARFEGQARGADTALIFYSGHGMEIGGRNYLIPTDASLRSPGDERAEAVDLRHAIEAVSFATRLSIVIVDACRNGAPGARGARGFLEETAAAGLVIAFSTAPGSIAYDGAGRLSPFTHALTERLSRNPNEDVRILFNSLGPDVRRFGGGDQEPYSRIGGLPQGNVSLIGSSGSPAPPPPPTVVRTEPTGAEELESEPQPEQAPQPGGAQPPSSEAAVYANGAWSGATPPSFQPFSALEIARKYCSDSWGDCGYGDFSEVAPSGHDHERLGVSVCADDGRLYQLTHTGRDRYRFAPLSALSSALRSEVEANTERFERSLRRWRRIPVGDELLQRVRGVREYGGLFGDDVVCES